MENSREADISTEQSGAQAPAWISFPHEDSGRAACFGTPACARPQKAERLNSAGRGSCRAGTITGIDDIMTTAEATTPDSADPAIPLIARLPKRRDFLRIAATKRRWAAPGLVLQTAPIPDDAEMRAGTIRVGFTATRKIGNAVVRNRARRRLRAAVREIIPTRARPDLDYVLIARAATGGRTYAALRDDLVTALDRCDALAGNEGSQT
jgi:ribonuclease P protein component